MAANSGTGIHLIEASDLGRSWRIGTLAFALNDGAGHRDDHAGGAVVDIAGAKG